MSFGSALSSLLWFIAILALIPAALWLLKRTPAGGAAMQGAMRTVAVLSLSPSQRIVTVEVGRGDARRWRKVRPKVIARFQLQPEGWRNETLDEVLRESAALRTARSEAGVMGAAKRWRRH